MLRLLALAPLLALAACGTDGSDRDRVTFGADLGALPTPPDTPPAWAAEAVWYQIFPERFRNGDPSNDPTPESMEGSWPQVGADSLRLVGWAPQDWTSDWYAQAAWERALRPGDVYFTAQARRYGGDLQGIIDRLGYLDSLGVTALYLNPLNDSPSLHKYDARAYRHVDPHFGPDPGGDKEMIALEDPADPETWSTTAADGLFLDLLEQAHARGMRVVLDVSFNHTGTQFWAFQDVLQNGRDSDYADWYRIDAWDDPATPDSNEFAYTGWAGVPELPEFAKPGLTGDPAEGVPFEGDLAPGPKAHALAVALRWLDPDGDGDPSDGVDGFRLDVAEQVPLGFWRDLRRLTKAVNQEALLVGEIWWERWPEVMSDPAPYLGDAFDSVMHYRPFRPLRQMLDPAGGISPVDAAAELDGLYTAVPPDHLPALMAMSGSHDTPRLATTLQNAGVPYKDEETPRIRPGYIVTRPDAAAQRAARLFRLLQVTLPGAPHVYYGDEVGMWGADDPDPRKPMVWADLAYADEVALPGDSARATPDPVVPDRDLFAFTRRALALRQTHADLFARGTLQWDATAELLRFTRRLGDQTATVVVNVSDRPELSGVDVGTEVALAVGAPLAEASGEVVLPARSGAVFLAETGR